MDLEYKEIINVNFNKLSKILHNFLLDEEMKNSNLEFIM